MKIIRHESLAGLYTHDKLRKEKGITLVILVITIIILLILTGITIVQLKERSLFRAIRKAELEFSYEKRFIEPNKFKIVITIKDKENGLNKIEYPEGDILNCNGKNEVGIDYEVNYGEEYKFKITSNNGYEKEITICEDNTDIFGVIKEEGKTINDLNEYGITVTRSGYDEYSGYNELYNLGMGSGRNINRNTFVLTIDYETLISRLGNRQFKGIYGKFFQSAWTYDWGYESWVNSKIIVTYEDDTKYETPEYLISARHTTTEKEHDTIVMFEENKKVSKIEMIIDMYDADYGNAIGCIKYIELIK